MKAITITEKNQDMLANRYGIIDPLEKADQLPIGYILVTDFGNEDTFDVLIQEVFDATFIKIGDIDNEFIDIARK